MSLPSRPLCWDSNSSLKVTSCSSPGGGGGRGRVQQQYNNHNTNKTITEQTSRRCPAQTLHSPSSEAWVRNFSPVKYPFCRSRAEVQMGATRCSRFKSAALSRSSSTQEVSASTKVGIWQGNKKNKSWIYRGTFSPNLHIHRCYYARCSACIILRHLDVLPVLSD